MNLNRIGLLADRTETGSKCGEKTLKGNAFVRGKSELPRNHRKITGISKKWHGNCFSIKAEKLSSNKAMAQRR